MDAGTTRELSGLSLPVERFLHPKLNDPTSYHDQYNLPEGWEVTTTRNGVLCARCGGTHLETLQWEDCRRKCVGCNRKDTHPGRTCPNIYATELHWRVRYVDISKVDYVRPEYGDQIILRKAGIILDCDRSISPILPNMDHPICKAYYGKIAAQDTAKIMGTTAAAIAIRRDHTKYSPSATPRSTNNANAILLQKELDLKKRTKKVKEDMIGLEGKVEGLKEEMATLNDELVETYRNQLANAQAEIAELQADTSRNRLTKALAEIAKLEAQCKKLRNSKKRAREELEETEDENNGGRVEGDSEGGHGDDDEK